jgi:hypothetical protein
MNHYHVYAFNLSFYFFVTSLLLASFLFVQICRDFMIFAENSWIHIQCWMLAPPDVGPNIQIVQFHFKFIFHVTFRCMSSWSILFWGSVSHVFPLSFFFPQKKLHYAYSLKIYYRFEQFLLGYSSTVFKPWFTAAVRIINSILLDY